MPKFAVILPAAGKSSRFQDVHYKKPFAPLSGKAVWLHSVETFLKRDDVKQVIVVVSPDDLENFKSNFGANIAILGIDVVTGGTERADSVQNGLQKVTDDIDFIAVHDAARPCISEIWIDNVFKQAQKTSAAILAIPVTSTLKRVDQESAIKETVPRSGLWQAQTPQVFKRDLLVECYQKRGKMEPTDESELVESFGHVVNVVAGSPLNIKVTSKSDLHFASLALKALPKPKLDRPIHPFAGDDLFR